MLSVHMTTHRRKRSGLLKQAVESVLNQTFTDFEFIVIDDCSFDGTSEYLARVSQSDNRIKVIRNASNVNSIAVSLGRALTAASDKAKYITWMFDDNIIDDTAFEKLIETASKNRLDVCFGITKCHDKDGHSFLVGDRPLDEIRSGVAKSSVLVPNAGILFSKSIFDQVGWYDSNIILRRSCDWDLFARIFSTEARIGNIDEVLVQEYGGLQPDSLRNNNRSTFGLMKKYVQLRDQCGWKMDLYAALNHPEDRIPDGPWSPDELKLIYSLFIEYYVSTGNFERAHRWSNGLLNCMTRPHYLDNLELLLTNADGAVANQALGAIAVLGNALYLANNPIQSGEAVKPVKVTAPVNSVAQTPRNNVAASTPAVSEETRAQADAAWQELHMYRTSIAHRTASYLATRIRRAPLLHSLLRSMLLAGSRVMRLLGRPESRVQGLSATVRN